MAARSRVAGPTLGAAAALIVVAGGLAIGLAPMSDNSFLTHLATGRLILDRGSVPSTDPYTFTAHGDAWVVQSWFVSVVMATAERIGGMEAVRALVGVAGATLAYLAWRMLAPAEAILLRLALGALFLLVASGQWSERPFMVGLLCFALTMRAAAGAMDPRWLLPVGVLWLNCHGSFPLGVVFLVVGLAGGRLDGSRELPEARALLWLLGGIALGAAGPLGLRGLLFPLDLLGRGEVLQHVVEWQSPAFTSIGERAFLVQVVLAVVLLARRPSYRGAILLVVFTAAALVSSRNITVASLVLLPVMAQGAPVVGTLRGSDRSAIARPLALVGASLVVVVAVVRTSEPPLALERYPVDALAFLDGRGIDLAEDRLAAPDIVGNLLELIYGAGERVFYDDRFDMFPASVSDAHLALVRSSPDLRSELLQHSIDVVIVGRESPAATWMAADPDWRLAYSDELWVAGCRRGAHACG